MSETYREGGIVYGDKMRTITFIPRDEQVINSSNREIIFLTVPQLVVRRNKMLE